MSSYFMNAYTNSNHGDLFHLWQMGSYFYSLTKFVPMGDKQFQTIRNFPDSSLEEVQEELMKEGFSIRV